MNHGRAAARRRHAMRAVTDWQEQLRSLAVEMQDLAVQIDGHDEEAAGWMYRTAGNLFSASRGLDNARDALRSTQTVQHQ